MRNFHKKVLTAVSKKNPLIEAAKKIAIEGYYKPLLCKQNNIPLNQKNKHESIFKEALIWCPLFGCLPDISRAAITKHPLIIYFNKNSPQKGFTTASVADECLLIIKKTRSKYWGKTDFNLIKNNPYPEIHKLPIKYKEEAIKARILFQNIHTLLWGSLPIDDPRTSMRRITPPKYDVLKTEKPNLLLANAQCCIGADLGSIYLDKIYAIFIIHEAWCLLHDVLSSKYKPSDIAIIHNAFNYMDDIEKEADIRRQLRILALKNQKIKLSRKSGGRVTEPIRIAIKIVIEKVGVVAKDIWGYFEKNHRGPNKGINCDYKQNQYLIYFDGDSDGEEKLFQLNVKTKKVDNKNAFKQFATNLTKVKKEIKNS